LRRVQNSETGSQVAEPIFDSAPFNTNRFNEPVGTTWLILGKYAAHATPQVKAKQSFSKRPD
jgi:hypothetical protein